MSYYTIHVFIYTCDVIRQTVWLHESTWCICYSLMESDCLLSHHMIRTWFYECIKLSTKCKNCMLSLRCLERTCLSPLSISGLDLWNYSFSLCTGSLKPAFDTIAAKRVLERWKHKCYGCHKGYLLWKVFVKEINN